jgi:hypothetical protein
MRGKPKQLTPASAIDGAIEAPPPYRLIVVDEQDYVAFPRKQVLELAQELIKRFGQLAEIPVRSVRRAPEMVSSSQSGASASSSSSVPDVGGGARGDAAACVPAAPLELAPPRARKPNSGHLWPAQDEVAVRTFAPRKGSLGEVVFEYITAAGQDGLDVAGICIALDNAGVSIADSDRERAITNVIYGTLRPRGLIERCERKDQQAYWRCVTP